MHSTNTNKMKGFCQMEMNKEVKLQKPLVLVERRSQMTAIYTPATNQTWKKIQQISISETRKLDMLQQNQSRIVIINNSINKCAG